jgi:hypothetical protein
LSRRSIWGLSVGEWIGVGALTLWALVPVVVNLRHAAAVGGHWTGAEGPFAADQLHEMTWIRDEGAHFLASNLMDTAPSSHVYLNPMFLLSGLAWRLGVSLPASLLAWKPIAIAVMSVGAALYARRLLASARERVAAVLLALFYYVPLLPLAWWLGLVGTHEADRLQAPIGQLFVAGQQWGYLPAAIAVGLMPVCLLCAERALRSRAAWPLAGASLAALLASWLHPWQGETLALILGALIAWGGAWRSRLSLAWPLAAAVAPVVYYFVLSRSDPAWRVFALQNEVPRYDADALALALAPLLLAALLGARRPAASSLQERALLVWPLAGLLVYFALSPSQPGHGLIGITIPLAVLAVRGAVATLSRRGRAPATVAAVVAVAALTLPGAAFTIERYVSIVRDGTQAGTVSAGEDAAMRWLRKTSDPGGVLAPSSIGAAVPVETGRRTWVGHASMTPDYYARARQAEALFTGRLGNADAQLMVRGARVRFVLSDCRGRVALDATLAPLLARSLRFGCATVYELRPGAA